MSSSPRRPDRRAAPDLTHVAVGLSKTLVTDLDELPPACRHRSGTRGAGHHQRPQRAGNGQGSSLCRRRRGGREARRAPSRAPHRADPSPAARATDDREAAQRAATAAPLITFEMDEETAWP